MRLSVVSLALAISPILAEPTAVENGQPMSLSARNASTSSDPNRELIVFNDCLMGHNIALTGTSYTNFRANQSTKCCATCRNLSGVCVGYTWTNHNGGTCYLYNKYSFDYSIVVGADTCTIEGSAFWFGDCDMPGNDLSNKRMADWLYCEDECQRTPSCKGATWTNYEGGTCWLKRDVRTCVYKQGAVSIVAQNQLARYLDGLNLP